MAIWFQPFLNFKAQSVIFEIEMKQKRNRNLLAHDWNIKRIKYDKGNLTETINVKKVKKVT